MACPYCGMKEVRQYRAESMLCTVFACGSSHKVIDLLPVDYEASLQSTECLRALMNPYSKVSLTRAYA